MADISADISSEIARHKGDDQMAGKQESQNPRIHAFGFQITDVIVAELVKSYILHMRVDAAREQMSRILGVEDGSENGSGQERKIDIDELGMLIENARAAAGIAAMEWKAQKEERLLKTTIHFLRDEFLPNLDGREYAETMPEKLMETLEECWLAVSEEAL